MQQPRGAVGAHGPAQWVPTGRRPPIAPAADASHPHPHLARQANRSFGVMNGTVLEGVEDLADKTVVGARSAAAAAAREQRPPLLPRRRRVLPAPTRSAPARRRPAIPGAAVPADPACRPPAHLPALALARSARQ